MIDALPLLLGPEGYQISRSVRLRSSASAYFNRSVWSSANRRTWKFAGWVKRGRLGVEQAILGAYDGVSSWATRFYFTSGDALAFDFGFAAQNQLLTTAVFRDPSAWYFVELEVDMTQAQASHSQANSRIRIKVNGTQQITSGTMIAQNTDTMFWINGNNNYVGTRNTEFLDGYLAEINVINGAVPASSSFGEINPVTGVWQPRRYTGTYGTNGFYLNFSDNSNNTAATIGKDYSGNGNNWTPNNISVTSGSTYDSMLDVPTQWADGGNGRGNYAVLNPLDQGSGTNQFIKEGNLLLETGSTGYSGTRCTIAAPSTGKWYWEITQNVIAGGMSIGIASANTDRPVVVGESSTSYGYQNDGLKRTNLATASYGASYTTNDLIGVALDMDAGTLTFYKNNTSQGTAFSSLSGSFMPMLSDLSNSQSSSAYINFGQRPFAYTPPTGFKALNTLNLPAPTILKGNQYFDATTYTGNGSTLSVTNSGSMQPDLVWYKSRGAARDHGLFDSVRGATAYLGSNLTNAEQTVSGVTAFNSNGFTLGSAIGGNNSGEAFVGWQWKEGATQGFDIVTYSGTSGSQNVSHNLGVAPKLILVKQRNGGAGWRVYSASLANTQALELNATSAAFTQNVWNNTTPTSSVFSVTDTAGTWTNGSGNTYVAYLFSEVAGFSRFGSYTGNGSTDGPFVYTGFRVKYLLCKRTDVSEGWQIMDAVRNTYNVANTFLEANQSNAEGTSSARDVDFLSNGFKIRNTSNAMNASGGTYIFAAFSESPFKNALAR
jgi:hypothetical protein